MLPALFLDRDGVIIENRPGYVRSWADVDIFPQALKALAHVKDSPYKIVIVSNQSAVGRGFVEIRAINHINDRLLQEIRHAGGRVDGVFICPHAPQEDCACRKPKPGLLLQAASSLSLDLSRSIMVGDALSDLLAGEAAGVQNLVLVKTGRGADQLPLVLSSTLKRCTIYETLLDAMKALVPA